MGVPDKIHEDRTALLKAAISALTVLRIAARGEAGGQEVYLESRSGSFVKATDTIDELERAIFAATGAHV